ncbi:MAG: hemolysin [Rhodospirillales bacterium]|nr:hemolysin [Rhodospirillales bacterium]
MNRLRFLFRGDQDADQPREGNDEAQRDEAAHARELIQNIRDLRDLPVSDLMVPRADIVAVEIETPRDDLLRLIAEHQHSRMPVYRETLDDVLGFIHIKDVMATIAEGGTQAGFDLQKLLRPVKIVAPSMRVLDLLLDMRKTRQQLALVVDEFGGIDGLVTIEDLIEGIVGDIADEHDVISTPDMTVRPDGSLVADARVSIEDFESRVGHLLTEDERAEIDTLGGLVVSLAGRVPPRGELLRHPSGLEFEVLDADPRRIKRLRVLKLDEATARRTGDAA